MTRFAVLCLAWVLVGTVSFARHALNAPPGAFRGAPFASYVTWLACYLPWGPLTFVVLAVERRVPLDRRGWPKSLAVLLALAVPAGYAAWLATAAVVAAVAAWSGRPAPGLASPVIPAADLVGHLLLYAAAVGGAGVYRTLGAARESERRAARLRLEKAQLETDLRQAELDALRMRLQPHFLFNSLQNISVLVRDDAETGSRMLTRLGDLLRASLAGDGAAETTLEAEVALTRAYLSIEQMRFGDRLRTLVEVAPETRLALVPTFLLQPLVENALRHGLRDVREAGVLAVRSAAEAGRLVLTVSDNGVGPGAAPSAGASGIGLGATGERLARLYPGAHALDLRALPEGGTEVRVALPLRFAPAIPGNDRVLAAAADRG